MSFLPCLPGRGALLSGGAPRAVQPRASAQGAWRSAARVRGPWAGLGPRPRRAGSRGRPRPRPRIDADALRARLLAHLVRLDHVIDLDVVERPQPDAALVTVADLGRIVLEPLERVDGEALAHHLGAPQHPGSRAAADDARPHERTGDVAEPAGAEHLAHLCGTELDLLVLRLEHALEGRLDVVDRLVDHRVEAHVDALALGELLDPLGELHVEADDDRAVDGRQVDVVLRDRADTAVDAVSYTHLRAHETRHDLVCRLL